MPLAPPRQIAIAARNVACYRIRLLVTELQRGGKPFMKYARLTFLLIALALAACHSSHEQADLMANQNVSAINAAPRSSCIDLNKASIAELMQLPGVGEVMSRRIVEYRERHGSFRRPAEVIIIEGFSEKKYRAIADRVCAE